ncbi:MAG: hypothetical protein FJ299_07750 [Planctomycetes bacterium]|nr:hypothetical protein [Planctomycetota bacterium]
MKVFAGRHGDGSVVVVDIYRHETRTFVLGGVEVECAILQETEFENGELVEISQNYYAQSDDGVVYYFGEVVDNYEDGKVTGHGGSWLVGGPTLPTDPAETAAATTPAVFMPEDPDVGDVWKPEDLFPFVDETAECVAEDQLVSTLYAQLDDCIKVKETSALSSGFEHKFYAPGLGLAREQSPNAALVLVVSTLLPDEND